jgi:hypothetical protein
MATDTTDNLGLTTVEAGDRLPETVSKDNFEILDQYVAATAMTNKSGSQRSAGDVVIADTTADNAYTTTTSANINTVVGVVQETTAIDAAGIVKHFGKSTVKVTGATSRGNWLVTSTTAGQASAVASASQPDGAFAIALTATVGAGSVTALLLAAAPPSTSLSSSTPSVDSILGSAGASADAPKADHSHPGTFVVHKTATETVNGSAALQSDDELTFTAEASTAYLVELVLRITSNSTADWKFAWTLTNMTWDGVYSAAIGSSTAEAPIGDAAVASGVAATQPPACNGLGLFRGTFIIRTGATAGACVLQWAQNTSNGSDTQVMKNSVMRVTKLGAV